MTLTQLSGNEAIFAHPAIRPSTWGWFPKDALVASRARARQRNRTPAATRAAPAAKDGPHSDDPAAGTRKGPKTILVVAKEPELYQCIVDSLCEQRVPLHLATARHPYDAVGQIASLRPDLIIVDLTLPGLDGYQFCWQLKQKPAFQNVKVFAIADGVTSVDVALIC